MPASAPSPLIPLGRLEGTDEQDGAVHPRHSDDDRSDVPTELRWLAKSSSHEDRARAGQRLAARGGDVQVDELLLGLLLDEYDTSVTYETAKALLERRDVAATRILARACAVLDPHDLSFEWLGDAVNDVWLQDHDDARTALALTAGLSADPDEAVRTGAANLRALIEFGDWPRKQQPRPPGRPWSRLLRRLQERHPNVP